MKFSNSAWKVWAKKQGDQSLWLPLIVHLADCVDVAERLWENWLSDGIKMKLAEPYNSIETAKRVFIFTVATHDLAKATVLFQSKPSFPTPNLIDDELVESLILTGLDVIPYQEQMNNNNSPHAFAGEVMLLIRGCPKSVAVIVGSHHGKPSNFNYNAKSSKDKTIAHAYYRSYNKHYLGEKEHSQAWQDVQEEFIQFALENSGFDKITDLPNVTQESQMIYTGLLIMADWIASNTNYYPLFSLDENVRALDFHSRHQNAWEKLNLPYGYRQQFSIDEKTLCEERFGFTPNELQKTVVEIAQNMNGGIMVIEAPMGIGKTESALLVAEMFMTQQERTGVFFALPTQATSDGIFIRFKKWMDMLDDEQHSFQLSHGKVQFNDEFMKMDRLGGSSGIWAEENQRESGAVVHTWLALL